MFTYPKQIKLVSFNTVIARIPMNKYKSLKNKRKHTRIKKSKSTKKYEKTHTNIQNAKQNIV